VFGKDEAYLIRPIKRNDILHATEIGGAVDDLAENGRIPVHVHRHGVNAPEYHCRVVRVDTNLNARIKLAALLDWTCKWSANV
jgi:hypothetical protein